jgi:ferredoxin-NADP reductase/mono/diheme cytochrome c family protein
MPGTSVSITLGVLFVAIGALNVWLILESTARVKNAKASSRLVAAHRIGGYIFIMLYCVMGYFMIARMRDSSGATSTGGMIHMTIAMLLSPLLFVKVLIARYYKSYYNFLLPIGLLIFVLSFVLVAITAGPYLLRRASLRRIAIDEINLSATIDTAQVAATMRQRCSTCHNLDRVVGARKDARGWLATVNRMREMPAAEISEDDVKSIVLYLVSKSPQNNPEAKFAVAKALVAQRCASCHTLDRVYKTGRTPDEWRDTVAEMIERAQSDGNASAFQPGEDKQIVEFLAATQSPDAVNRRKAQAIAASSAGQSVVIPKTTTDSLGPAPRNGFLNYKTAVFPAIGCAVMAMLIVRRPSRSSGTASANGSAPVAGTNSVQPASSSAGNAMLLQLVRITEQTHDSKTLRFAVLGSQRPTARPGQFVTFSLLFDGKKVIRSYSICSSPLVSGYIEITPKRVAKGCASVFLNDRAVPGMMVEASGPYGQFCFDEDKHQRVVLIAAGSGITPIMAMLRYMDDLNLPTRATLLYCSRTERDIIFQKELAGLGMRLKNFDYRVLLSQPSTEWKGERGHINWSFVKSAVKEPGECDYFICGPAPFMDSTRRILGTLGVAPERIIPGRRRRLKPIRASNLSGPARPVRFARGKRFCRRPRSGESPFVSVAARVNAAPAKPNSSPAMSPWMPNRDSRPKPKRKASCSSALATQTGM